MDTSPESGVVLAVLVTPSCRARNCEKTAWINRGFWGRAHPPLGWFGFGLGWGGLGWGSGLRRSGWTHPENPGEIQSFPVWR